jgi:hypothetical protein
VSDTYRISVPDMETNGFEVQASGLTKWEIRRELRFFYGNGFTSNSVLVEAETHNRPAARSADRGGRAMRPIDWSDYEPNERRQGQPELFA